MVYNLIIETCSSCNLKCQFCPQYKYKLRNKTMSMKLFKKIVDSLEKLEIPIDLVTFSGMEEPFLDKYLFERIEYIRKICSNIETYTNGILLNEELLKKIKENFTRIYLSIHGNKPEEYEKYTGNKFSDIKKIAQLAYSVLGNKLIISNHPKGELERFLEIKVSQTASYHPLFNWGESTIAKKINSKLTSQRYCEIMLGIVIRVDGTIATCCSDWNNKNNILKGKFPRCYNCSNIGFFKSIQNELPEKIELLKKLRSEIDR